ncbi:MAG: glycosyl transferase [Lachnospiraceae bacterium]|nr:glycosyl transferase [Lachnospiraceae bacterium]
MILVTLGTQKFQMNRLVEAADSLAEQVGEEVFVQTGNSTYIPKLCKYSQFVDSATYKEMIENCNILITHSGVGSIMTGINAKKPVIVVPRLKQFHEHVDDHQLEIAKAFEGKGCVLCCEDVSSLAEYVEKAKTYTFQPYTAPEGKIEEIILDFLEACE